MGDWVCGCGRGFVGVLLLGWFGLFCWWWKGGGLVIGVYGCV